LEAKTARIISTNARHFISVDQISIESVLQNKPEHWGQLRHFTTQRKPDGREISRVGPVLKERSYELLGIVKDGAESAEQLIDV
jgi:hypothetical protein